MFVLSSSQARIRWVYEKFVGLLSHKISAWHGAWRSEYRRRRESRFPQRLVIGIQAVVADDEVRLVEKDFVLQQAATFVERAEVARVVNDHHPLAVGQLIPQSLKSAPGRASMSVMSATRSRDEFGRIEAIQNVHRVRMIRPASSVGFSAYRGSSRQRGRCRLSLNVWRNSDSAHQSAVSQADWFPVRYLRHRVVRLRRLPTSSFRVYCAAVGSMADRTWRCLRTVGYAHAADGYMLDSTELRY